ncbi:MAG: C_GCAxxG_C_C family protein [bacterium]|nr:C_GCAxxG_C_C family protein [bacterium]
MTRVEQAVQMFVDGYSCAQSLAATYGPDHGLPRETALSLASPFAGGVSCTGGTCGGVAGALLVLGLAHGPRELSDEAGYDRIRSLTQEFLRRFRAREGSILCTDILGHDLTKPGVLERVQEQKLSLETCPQAVRTAAEILEDMLLQR